MLHRRGHLEYTGVLLELAHGLIPETAHWQAAEMLHGRARVTAKSQNPVALRQNPATRAKALRRS